MSIGSQRTVFEILTFYETINYDDLAKKASKKQHSHVDYLAKFMDGEAAMRHDRATKRRISQARFPVIKALDQFEWSWPRKINRQSNLEQPALSV